MDDLAGLDAERPTDEVEAARAWLRRYGVEPPPEPGMGVRSGADRHDRRRGPRPDLAVGLSGSRARADGLEADGLEADGLEADGLEADGLEADGLEADGLDRGRSDEHASNAPTESRDAGGLDPDADPEDVARRIVLRKLAAQARTRAELERALQKKAVPVEAATAVLDRMSEVGLVDDVTFAHDWVASRQQRRHLSRTALRRELQTKGVDREVIDDALADVDVADERQAALDLARRRAAAMVGLSREVAYRRLGGVLGRRGFSPAVTTRVLAEVLDDVDHDGSDPPGP